MKQPLVLSPGAFSSDDLAALRRNNKIWKEVDLYDGQLRELYEITHPSGAGDVDLATFCKQAGEGELAGAWVYYPWSGILMHCLGRDDLFRLRTNRNRNIITAEEQDRLATAVVAVAGMSVGSGIAMACVNSGMASTIKIADFDELETANLNRLAQSLSNVGKPKVDLTARRIFELDPFTQVKLFGKLDENSLKDFFQGPRSDVVVDEIDDFAMKVRLRLEAKATKTALLMFTSLGDNILVDVERYDQDHDPPLFNGAIGDTADEILEKAVLSPEEIQHYAVKVVGPQYVPTRALSSLPEIGKTLVGRPQLYSTIAVDGGLAAYVIRSLILGVPLASGRYFIKFNELFNLPDSELSDTAERAAILQKIMKK